MELIGYYNNQINDSMTSHLKQFFHHWRDVMPLSDEHLVKQIRSDGVDILIDLSGHSSLNRLPAFAHKPAPVQASWIGYPGTTGLTAVDYFFCDRHYLPAESFARQFTEKLVYLPGTSPVQPYGNAPPVNELPALSNGHLTFGSFNRLGKISTATVELWAALMLAVPDAKLIVGGIRTDRPDDNPLSERLLAAGVALERVRYYLRSDMDAYLGLHHQVDLCLDTFPYTGGTTTYHAMWMGVPTLSLAGPTPAGRQGPALPLQLGLERIVSASREEYLANGVYWSAHIAELAAIRAGSRALWRASPVGNPDVIAASLVRALRHMWTRWCAGQPPESFDA